MERSPELSSVILPTCFDREVVGPPVRGKVQPVLRVWAIPELCPEGSLALSVQTPAHHRHTDSFYTGCCTPVKWQ